MVYNEHRAQQFAYWNRIRTSQPDPSNVEYVLGTCRKKCAHDYLESSMQMRYDPGVIPNAPDELIVGKSDDARLFTLLSAVMGSWIRSAASRDTRFHETENQARHIIAHVDAYGPGLRWSAGSAYLLMSQVKVVRKANGDIALSVVATKYHNWGEMRHQRVLSRGVRPDRNVVQSRHDGLDQLRRFARSPGSWSVLSLWARRATVGSVSTSFSSQTTRT